MSRRRRVFVISDFKDECPKFIQRQLRMWIGVLPRPGCMRVCAEFDCGKIKQSSGEKIIAKSQCYNTDV